MLLDICKTHRQRYGYLIRQKRIALGMTQKRLIEKNKSCNLDKKLYCFGKWQSLTGYGKL